MRRKKQQKGDPYVICSNPDKTEIVMVTLERWEATDPTDPEDPIARDTECVLMEIIHEFRAESWDLAREYEQEYLYGKR